ncbi:MAG: hypothetical protein ACYDHW_16305 [Syntrophorhabdaceae bacterium]
MNVPVPDGEHSPLGLGLGLGNTGLSAMIIIKSLGIWFFFLSFSLGHAFGADIGRETGHFSKDHPRRANFADAKKSPEARKMADWVVDSKDNNGMPFVIVDKRDARVFVFDPDGELFGSAPALLGVAWGDDSIVGIGSRPLSAIRRKERTTPAGRFLASLGYNTDGKDVLWVDYENAISLHRVITDEPRERRLQRLASTTPHDNRISYGCINVPKKFYEQNIRPVFKDKSGVVYILPDTRPTGEVFETYYDIDE